MCCNTFHERVVHIIVCIFDLLCVLYIPLCVTSVSSVIEVKWVNGISGALAWETLREVLITASKLIPPFPISAPRSHLSPKSLSQPSCFPSPRFPLSAWEKKRERERVREQKTWEKLDREWEREKYFLKERERERESCLVICVAHKRDGPEHTLNSSVCRLPVSRR